MTSFALALLFITQLAVIVGMLWLWFRVKDRMSVIEAKANEALDDQDLMDFQERVGALLSQVKEAGAEVVKSIDERRAGLDREGSRARESEKRLAEKIKDFERVEAKARKRLDEWAAGQARKGTARPKERAKKSAAAEPDPLPAAEEPRPLKVTYLKRDFHSPEPQAPVTPTATRYLKVYEMSDQGSSREEIAKACGYLPGEVELILNLRPRPRG